jgi:putative (di)nucleoside polyphosphate hydrolase
MSELSAYRPNVGVVLFHPDGRVWLGRRVNTPGPYNWQFPQGGVDAGEDLFDAARRELFEETGVTSVDYLGETADWMTYDFPPYDGPPHRLSVFRGQRQKWFAFRFTGAESEIKVLEERNGQPVEFDAWRWEPLANVASLVVPFRREIYQAVAQEFARFSHAA